MPNDLRIKLKCCVRQAMLWTRFNPFKTLFMVVLTGFLISIVIKQCNKPKWPPPDIAKVLQDHGLDRAFAPLNEAFIKQAARNLTDIANTKAYGYVDKEELTSSDGEATIVLKYFQEARLWKNTTIEEQYVVFITSGNPAHKIVFDDESMTVSICNAKREVLTTSSNHPLTHSLVRHLAPILDGVAKREQTMRVYIIGPQGQQLVCLRDPSELDEDGVVPSMYKRISIVGGYARISVEYPRYSPKPGRLSPQDGGKSYPVCYDPEIRLFNTTLVFDIRKNLILEDLPMLVSHNEIRRDFLSKRELIGLAVLPGGLCELDERSSIHIQCGDIKASLDHSNLINTKNIQKDFTIRAKRCLMP